MDTIVGSRLGTYLVEKRLGQGGMATVFLGLQPSTGRRVAIKTLPKAQLSNAQAVARFEREARVLANLQHPHILPLIDYGEMGDYKFLVVPYLAHGDLEDRLQRVAGALDPAESRRILVQLAEALDHAHRQGVIHRDLKPGNVLLDEQGNAMLADFGIAFEAGSDRLTGVGFTVGTPEYMAPEQVNGQPEARSDLYALGILAFRLLTGSLPFKGSNATATLLLQRDTPAPDPRQFNPTLSEDVVAFLHRALAKPLAERYQSGAEFARHARAVLPEVAPAALETVALEGAAVPAAHTLPQLQVPLARTPTPAAGSMLPSAADPDLLAMAARALQVGGSTGPQPAVPGSVATGAAVRPAAESVQDRGLASAPHRPLWIAGGVLALVGLGAGVWLSSRHHASVEPAPEIRVPAVIASPADAGRGGVPVLGLYDDFRDGLDRSRWRSMGGLELRVHQQRLHLRANGPGQWLALVGVADVRAAAVRVSLSPPGRETTEAAAGLTLGRGDWWLSCYLYRYAGSGQLESRCMENDRVVHRGPTLSAEPHELGIIEVEGGYRFMLDGRVQATLQASRSLPGVAQQLGLSVWTPAQAGQPAVAEFDDVQVAERRQSPR